MSNRRERRRNAPRASRHLHSVPSQDRDAPENQPLMQMLRPALRTGDPIDFFMTMSSIIAATRPSGLPWQVDTEAPSLDMLVRSFIDTPFRETTAALRVLRELTDDDALRARIDTALASRRHPVPPWITDLGEATVTGVVNSVEELGDGENIAIGFRIPGEPPITIVTFIDHNLGSAVKDAFPFPGDHAELTAEIRGQAGNDIQVHDLDPAEARARLEGALERTDMTLGIPGSETWPQIRAWLEWLIRLLPEGGAAPDDEPWSSDAIAELAQEFARSPEAKPLRYTDTEDMAHTLAWLQGVDPMRWSPIVVEVLLADRLPRKIIDTPKNMARYPAVMRAFIRYCHRRNGISSRSTSETLHAVDVYERDFLARVNGETRADDPSAMVSEYLRRAIEDGHDPAEIMPSIIGRSVDDLDYDTDFPAGPGSPRRRSTEEALRRLHEMIYDSLAVAVGGETALTTLDTAPLPDEPFDWSGIPSDIRGPVGDVLELCDAAADEIFDVEHRTAMRRFLAVAARNAPEVFARKAAPERLAAAVAWVITAGNNSTGSHRGAVMTVKALLTHFGVKGSVSQRAEPLLRANGIVDLGYAQAVMSLGRTDLLTSARRRSIIAARDRAKPGGPSPF